MPRLYLEYKTILIPPLPLFSRRHNIPLSLTKANFEASQSDTALSYISPRPLKGIKYCRYTTVLFQQADRVDNISPLERDHFSLHLLAKNLSLTPSGIHFWRAKGIHRRKALASDVRKSYFEQDEPTSA